jgi:hypothetical protein
MSRSVRVFARQRQGRIPMNINLPAFEVTRRSAISITVGR